MKIKISIFFLFVSFNLFSQGVNNLWLMGYRGGGGGINMDFSGGILSISSQTNRIMNFDATNGVICDMKGNLLFSSNGIFVANAYNDTMMNGSGLNPSTYDSTSISSDDGLNIPQGNLVIPFPGDSTKYYLFHETIDDYYNTGCSYYFYYSIVDMNLDSGKGEVINKNTVLLNNNLVPGFITSCKHANGRDWWVFTHQYNTPIYYEYLVTPSRIQGPYIQNIGSPRGVYFGQMAFSPDGSKVAYYDPNNYLDLMDFDRCTGDFSNLIHVDINDSASGGGLAFSPDSKVLYVSSQEYIYQFDLTSSNISATQTTVAVWDGYSEDSIFATIFGPAQLAPDGKIYIACLDGSHYMHVINNPDSVGLRCDVCQHCITLPAFNAYTVANQPNYFLGAESGSICDSLEGVQSYAVLSSKLNIYPNPVVDGDEVAFSYGVSSERGLITIYNTLGKMVAQYSLPQWSSTQNIKLPVIASGLYLARLTQGTSIADVKFLKE